MFNVKYHFLISVYRLQNNNQITLWICLCVAWIPKGYLSLEKLVLNVYIKDFWYTNELFFSELSEDIFGESTSWFSVRMEGGQNC